MKKDLAPLLKADKKIDFLNQFPESDYAMDLKFEKFNSKPVSIQSICCKVLHISK